MHSIFTLIMLVTVIVLLTRKLVIWMDNQKSRFPKYTPSSYNSAPRPPKKPLPPVDPELYKWLETRKINDPNRSIKTKQYTLSTIPDRYNKPQNFVQSPSDRYEYTILTDPGNEFYINGRQYSVIVTLGSIDNPKKYESSRSGLIIHHAEVLIPPYFYYIRYEPQLHVFVAATYTNKADYIDDLRNGIYDCYVFDIHGRYIGKDQGHYGWRLPPVGIDASGEQETIVDIAPLPKGYRLQHIVNPYLFIVNSTFRLDGVLSNTGAVEIPCKYSTIIIQPPYEYAILQRQRQVFRFNIKTAALEALPYEFILDAHKQYIRVFTGFEEEDRKWGIIDTQGNEVVAQVHDYVQYGNMENRFIVFKGRYYWRDNDKDYEFFKDRLDYSNMHKQDDYHGSLSIAGWGVIDEQGNEILPCAYNWIEDTGEVFMVNKGGKIYGKYYGEGGEYLAIINGGVWAVYDSNGVMLEDFIYKNIHFLLNKYRRGGSRPIDQSPDDEGGLFITDWTGELDYSHWEYRTEEDELRQLKEETENVQ